MKTLVPALLLLAGCASAPRPPAQAEDARRHSAAGMSALASGDYHAAILRFDQALGASQALDDLPSQARDLHNRGLARLGEGDLVGADADLDAALKLSERGAAPARERALSHLALAQIRAALGRTPEADALAKLAAAEAAEAGDSALQARILATRAGLALRRGDTGACATFLDEGDRLAPEDAALRLNRAHLSLASGDAAKAGVLAEAALERFRAVGDGDGVASSLAALARARLAQGNRAGAAEAWRRAAAIPGCSPARRESWNKQAAEAEAPAAMSSKQP